MRADRIFKIEKKVFSKDDIKIIVEFIYNEALSLTKPSDWKSGTGFSIKLNCLDGSSYESSTLDFFEENSIIDRKKVESIVVVFNEFNPRRQIDFIIHEGNTTVLNTLRVSGDDSDWVNHKFHHLKELINDVPPQENFILKHQKIISLLCSIFLGVASMFSVLLFFSLINKWGFFYIESSSNKISFSSVLFNFILMCIPFCLIWHSKINNMIKSLWFNIEFNFGPSHLQVQLNKRKAIFIIITTFIIPLVFYILSIL
ncbi:hypothetical protein [Bacillus sp. Marseille-Q7846]